MSLLCKNFLDLARKFGPGVTAKPSFGRHLAFALEWSQGESKIETIQSLDFPAEVNQGLIGHQPAMIFAGHRRSQAGDLLRKVASFAYHSSIEWGIITNSAETIVFNSHWVRDKNWFALPPLSWSELQNNMRLIEALTPTGLTEGSIEREAHRFYEPDQVLLPVDDALVDILDAWRDETLRHATTVEDVDKSLQTLFAQLFVLRAVEDRGLENKIPALQTALAGSDAADLSRLQKIFRLAKEKIQSELFNIPLPEHIPEFVLHGIINDLYHPREFPIDDVRYNFAWIDTDVLGRAYEKYLSTVLIPSHRIDPQLRLWRQPKREIERVSLRKASGVYYTPEFIVQYLTEKCLQAYFEASEPNNIRIPSIADICCGSGSFLTKAVDTLIRILKSLDGANNWPKELVRKKAILGIDTDQRAVTLTRLALWLRFAEEPDPLPLPSLENIIVCGDSLKKDTWSGLPGHFDIMLGNPPFLPTSKVPTRLELSEQFRTATGRFDYSYLFVESAVTKLKDKGLLGFVVPNRLFRNRNAARIRELLTEETDLLSVVDFGSTEVFAGTSSYVGLICARKRDSELLKERLRFLKVRDLPTRFAGVMLLSADRKETTIKGTYLIAYPSRHPRGTQPWIFLSESEVRARIRLENEIELGTIANVFQGIKTGANDIFIVELESRGDGSICRVINGLGEGFYLERDCLRPVTYGSEIERYDTIRPDKLLIYPYENGHVIQENEFANKFPRTYKYLKEYYNVLSERISISGTKREWYEIVRKRKESWLEAKKLIIRDLATEPSFALDDDGSVFLVGGTAVVPQDPLIIEPLLGYLNSRISEWYLKLITPSFRAGFQKYEPQHIGRLPVPRLVLSEGRVRNKLTDLVVDALKAKMADDEKRLREIDREIDSLLLRATNLEIEEID